MLTNDEARDLMVELLTAETDRDRQVRVGPSNLADPCDRSVAYALLGETNRTAFVDRYWLGRVIGTAVGGLLEDRAAGKPGLEAEKRVKVGTIPGYGDVFGSIDLLVDRTVVDYKGAWRKDIALLEDYLQRKGLHRVGEVPRFKFVKAAGRQKYDRRVLSIATGTVLEMTEPEYEHALRKVEYKFNGYAGQTSLYALSGVADHCVIAMFARDGNAGFDNPGLDGYVDPRRKHDIWTWGFPADLEYAQALLDRAGRIWARLQGGGSPADFEAHELCFACSKAQEDNTVADITAMFEEKGEAA